MKKIPIWPKTIFYSSNLLECAPDIRCFYKLYDLVR